MASPHINDPAECFLCKRHAVGIGAGDGRRPRWVCDDCIPHIREIRQVRNFNPYEARARADAMEKVGALLEKFGKTDLGEFSEEEAEELLTTVIHEFGESLRAQVAELRAPW